MVTLYFMLCISFDLISYIWFISCNEFQTKNNLPKYLEHFSEAILKRYLFFCFFKTNNNACGRCLTRSKSKVNIVTQSNNKETSSQKDTVYIITSSDSITSEPIQQPSLNDKIPEKITTPIDFRKQSKSELTERTTPNVLTIFRDQSNKSIEHLLKENKKNSISTPPHILTKSEQTVQNTSPQAHLVQSSQKCNLCDLCEKCLKAKANEQDSKKKKTQFEERIRALNYFAALIICLSMFTCDLLIWLLISYPPNNED
jgi:hypothetical protein